MCGIADILNFQHPINPLELDRFTHSLAHRDLDRQGHCLILKTDANLTTKNQSPHLEYAQCCSLAATLGRAKPNRNFINE